MKPIFTVAVESIPADGLQIQSEWDTGIADEIIRQDDTEFKVSRSTFIKFNLLIDWRKGYN